MALKFLEFIDMDGRQVGVYVRQVSLEKCLRCFRIDVLVEERFHFLLCKEKVNEWSVVTQDFPELIVDKLSQPIIKSIERRLLLENDYLTPN